MTTHYARAKKLRDYPALKGHETAVIAALLQWIPVGAPIPTKENVGSFTMKQARIALRMVCWSPSISPEAKAPARAALKVLKGIYSPNRGV